MNVNDELVKAVAELVNTLGSLHYNDTWFGHFIKSHENEFGETAIEWPALATNLTRVRVALNVEAAKEEA